MSISLCASRRNPCPRVQAMQHCNYGGKGSYDDFQRGCTVMERRKCTSSALLTVQPVRNAATQQRGLGEPRGTIPAGLLPAMATCCSPVSKLLMSRLWSVNNTQRSVNLPQLVSTAVPRATALQRLALGCSPRSTLGAGARRVCNLFICGARVSSM